MKPVVFLVDDERRMTEAMAAALARVECTCQTFDASAASLAAFLDRGAGPCRDRLAHARPRRPRADAARQDGQSHHARHPGDRLRRRAVGRGRHARGAFDYLTKPFDNHELRTIVGRALELTRLERENRRLREDLFFRLNVIPVVLPPLRERREDVQPLAERFLLEHARESGRRLTLDPEAVQRLAAHTWPGSVRELQNVLQRAVVLARGATIAAEDLLFDLLDAGSSTSSDDTLQTALDRAAADRIRAALTAAGGRKAEAAASLGIDRTTLFRWMRRPGL